MAPGSEIRTGDPIAIFWDLDRKWYSGKVLKYNTATAICKVLYSDGERDEVDLKTVKHSFLWAGKLRERMGKSGGGNGGAKNRPFEYVVETLLDIEDRLPPLGVYIDKKKWWSSWHSRVSHAEKSENVSVLGKAAVEIAFQIKDNISTPWWNSQRLDWQEKVQSATTGIALVPRVTDLLTKAVDWRTARTLFPSDVPESDVTESLKDCTKDQVKKGRSAVEEGTGRRETRQHVIMTKEKIDSKGRGKIDEDSGVTKSTTFTPPRGVRRSKRNRTVEDDEELSREDSPDVGTPDASREINKNKSPPVKRQKNHQKAEEGGLSDLNELKFEKAQSGTETQGDQRSLRRSKRCLEPDHSEAEQTSEKISSGGKANLISSESTRVARNLVDFIGPEGISHLRDAKLPVRSSPRRLQISAGSPKCRLGSGASPKVSSTEESGPAQECESVKDGLKKLEHVPNGQVQTTPGPQKKTRLERADGTDGKENIMESSPTQERPNVKNGLHQLEQVPDVDVASMGADTKICKLENQDGDYGKEQINNSTESLGTSAALARGLSAQDSNVVTTEAFEARVERELRQAGKTEDEISCPTEPVGRTRREIKIPKRYDAATADGPKPGKAQSVGRQQRTGKKIGKSSEVLDDLKAGKENRKANGAEEKSFQGHNATGREGGQHGAGPSMDASDAETAMKRLGRLVRKVCESQHSGGARLKGLNEDGTAESSEEEEQNGRTRYDRSLKKRSRKIRGSESSDSLDEEAASGFTSEEASDWYKGEDDVQNPDIMDSWGERLPTDDSEDDDAPAEDIKPPQHGQAEISRQNSATVQDLGEETCATCNFAGAEQLMLLCDQSGCECAMHTFCLTPPLKSIPEGDWFCPHCTLLKTLPSDSRRPPKSCSSEKYPPRPFSIFGRRRDPSQEEGKTKVQYLVKWDSLSHEHDSWIPEDWLLYMNNRMVANFQRKYQHFCSDSNIDVDERRPEWSQVDRIIACRKQGSKSPIKPPQIREALQSRDEGTTSLEYLVKWHTLEHKSATWEEERGDKEFQQAITCFTERHERGEASLLTEVEAKPVAAIKMPPHYLRGDETMFGFQIHGLKWLLSNYEQRRSVILADEMGLGKTIQTLAFISCVRYENLSFRPALVIAPKSTLPGWENEFRKWSPGLNVVVYQGDKENRAAIREYEFLTASKKPLFEVLLTSYELAASDNTLLSRFHWASLTVDEGHRVKNMRAKLGILLKRQTADFRLLLTGTPVQNTLTELFALLHFLDPKEFADPEESARQFTEVDANGNKGHSDAKLIEQQVSKLHELLNPRMLRRLKTEVLPYMIPGKKLVKVPCALTPYQRHLYINILTKNHKVLNRGVKSGMKRSLQSILTDLKMVCNHPYLIPEKEPHLNDPAKAFKMMVEASGKLQLLEKLLPRLKENGHRVLLFSQMTKMLDILEDFMGFLGLSYSRIDGSSSAASRERSITEFNAADSNTFVFLISTRAGGLGINLPSADTVIIYDIDFNPFVDLQAQARAHRIGQDKTVLVYQLITKCTVEEKILQRSRKKLAMENLVMSRESKETVQDINTLLLHGAKKVLDEHDFEATSIKLTDEFVKELLDRELLTSTTIDDEPTAHGYLGAVQGDDLTSPTKKEQDLESKNGDGSEWHELLLHVAEEDEKEDLGRGKRLRKQVVYAAEGHGDGPEEEEYDPSSENESSSDSDSDRDSDGVSRKHSKKARGRGVGEMHTEQPPGMPTAPWLISSSPHDADAAGLFLTGDTQSLGMNLILSGNETFHPPPLDLLLHPTSTMPAARGTSNPVQSSSENFVGPRQAQEAASFGTVGDMFTASAAKAGKSYFGDLGSRLKAALSQTSRSHSTSQGGAMMPMHQTMMGNHFVRTSVGAGARPSTTQLSGAGVRGAHLTDPPPPFQGVHPYVNYPPPNSNVHTYPPASFLPTPVPLPPYNTHTLPSQPVPSQSLFTEGEAGTQSLNNIRNHVRPSFADLQQTTHARRMADVERPAAVSRSLGFEGGGGYMTGHHGSVGGCALPTTSTSGLHGRPSSVQNASGATHHPFPDPIPDQRWY